MRCCPPTTTRPAGWCMPGALEPASTIQSSNGCGAASNPWPCPRCHSTRHRRAQAGSACRPSSAASIGYGRSLSWTDDNLLRQVVYERLRRRQASGRGPSPGTAPETSRVHTLVRPVETASVRVTEGVVSGRLCHGRADNRAPIPFCHSAIVSPGESVESNHKLPSARFQRAHCPTVVQKELKFRQ